jgi:hypothetical protein
VKRISSIVLVIALGVLATPMLTVGREYPPILEPAPSDPGGSGGSGCNVPSGYSWGCSMACTDGGGGTQYCSGKGGTVDPTTICMISPSPGNACFDDANDPCCSQPSGF